MYNPTPYAYSISISLFGQNGLVAKKTYQIGADSGFTWSNFLEDFFAYSGAGALLFESQGTSTNYKFTVRSEVYNVSSSGTFTTVVPAIELASVSVPPPGSQFFFAMNGGINVNSFRRTNLGCVNYSSTSMEVLAAALNSSGDIVQEFTFTMVPFSWKQLPVTAQLSDGLVAWGSLRPITAFMVEVDNTSNDGSYFVATSIENLF
ncbi:MAG TPA: hypothetical protein VFS12_18780 [Terriglobia bacterium]|nr:hypothetical protein [Terriglobia bacterium]